MDNFDSAFAVVLKHEGGFVNDPNDKGGPTKYGVSLYWLKSQGLTFADVNHDGRIDIDDIKSLTPELAKVFYKQMWWDKYGYGNIANADIATRIFDMAVNMGGIQANKLAQRAATRCGQLCAADGVFGPVSFNAITASSPECWIRQFKDLCAEFYRTLTITHPETSKYLNGWLKRVYS
jgi:lysozyme family protein